MLLLTALIVLLQALILALTNMGLGAGWAALFVGVIVAGIGALLVKRGSTNMSPASLAPTRTAEQLRKDAYLAQEQTR
jgi:glycerol uptake facilitator-like aquaporin